MAPVRALTTIGAVLALVAVGCGGSDDSGADPDAGAAQETTPVVVDDTVVAEADPAVSAEPVDTDAPADAAEPAETSGGAPSGGGSGGTLELGDETIAFESARCFLQEQDAAAGGGKILFVAQAYGTNAAGEPLVLDVSRYDEDSQFHGDDVLVDIGDPFSDDAVSFRASGDVGTVVVDGSLLSAGALTFRDFDAGTESAGSFEINC